MLINRSEDYFYYYSGAIIDMSNERIMIASAKTTLDDIANQCLKLGLGLSNAAPATKLGAPPNNSIEYLFSISDKLKVLVKECENLFETSSESSSKT